MRKIILLFILSFCVLAKGEDYDEDSLKLGDECEYDYDCDHIVNAGCVNETCECVKGYVASLNNSYCLPLATKIGDKCDISEQCRAISSAQCLNNTCHVAQVITTLPPTEKPKDECAEDSDCTSFLLKRVCKNGTCVAGFPTIAPKIPGLDMFILGKPCANDSECSGDGSACVDKSCRCTDNFVPAQNLKSCLPKAKELGDKCSETVQCVLLNGSFCENEKCVKNKAMRVLENFGEKISSLLIGSSCQNDKECKHLTHALCIENVCQCKDNYITSVTSNSCLEKAKKEGDSCELDKQCEDIKGATCLLNKCVKPGVVGTKLGGNGNSGSTQTVSKLVLAFILFIKLFFV